MSKKMFKTALALVILAFCFSYLTSVSLLSAETSDEIKLPQIQTKVLQNGMKVMVIEQHNLPVVAFRLVLKTGAAYDPKDKAGLANLTAGLLRKGTTTRTAPQIAQEIDFVGGNLGAGADLDATYATCRVMSKYFDTGLDLLSDIILNPTFSESEVKRLKRQTLAAIIQKKDDPNTIMDEKFNQFLFGDHPYARPVSGDDKSVTAITPDDIVEFHKTFYAPNNVVLAVVGDVKADDVIKKVEAKFGNWQKESLPEVKFASPPEVKGYQILLVDKPDLTQAYISIGHLGLAKKDPDEFPSKVMNYILGGGGFSSRLMAKVRSEKGLTYGVYSSFNLNRDPGSFDVSMSTQVDSALAAIGAILEELKKIREAEVTKKELDDTKSFYTGYYPLQFETPEQVATQILNTEIYGTGLDYIKNYRKNIKQVTIVEVLTAAKQHIHPDDLKMVVVANAEKVKAGLEKLGTVKVIPFTE
ncbi:MAG: insulinase family protein [candidate division Zixibacteria bacterium]|nr:insulinase family protein [candidate division Zixibacteria bacterium]